MKRKNWMLALFSALAVLLAGFSFGNSAFARGGGGRGLGGARSVIFSSRHYFTGRAR